LRLCKSLCGTGKLVILDSGFCVHQATIELKKLGIYASALIKKRRYWPKYIMGDEIKEVFADKEIGHTDRLPGEIYGTKFDLFYMKEPDYVMMLMSTYGQLTSKTDQKDSWRDVDQPDGERTTKRFKYTEFFANHYYDRGAMDDHNNKRHDVGGLGVSLEDTWRTSRWEIRVFTFVCMAIVEVNAYLGRSFFAEKTETMLEFRRKLAYECVYNTIDEVGGVGEARQRQPKRYKTEHKLETAPWYCKWVNRK
jgi:Transposase IS4